MISKQELESLNTLCNSWIDKACTGSLSDAVESSNMINGACHALHYIALTNEQFGYSSTILQYWTVYVEKIQSIIRDKSL